MQWLVPISAGWQRVLPREANSTCKTHWGEEMVWLHWVRLITWVYTWRSKEMPLCMSADLARCCGRGLEVFISHRMPYRITMSMGICSKYLAITVVCYSTLQYISVIPMHPLPSRLNPVSHRTGTGAWLCAMQAHTKQLCWLCAPCPGDLC